MMHNLQNKLGVNGLKKQIRSKMKKKNWFQLQVVNFLDHIILYHNIAYNEN